MQGMHRDVGGGAWGIGVQIVDSEDGDFEMGLVGRGGYWRGLKMGVGEGSEGGRWYEMRS